jgi:hypothetical protein
LSCSFQWDHLHEDKFTDGGVWNVVSLNRQLLHTVAQMFLHIINRAEQWWNAAFEEYVQISFGRKIPM